MLLNKVIGSMKFQKRWPSWIFQKGGHLGFFQIVFGSKNVAKQSCRSMKIPKRQPSWIFKIPKRQPSWIFSNGVSDPKNVC